MFHKHIGMKNCKSLSECYADNFTEKITDDTENTVKLS